MMLTTSENIHGKICEILDLVSGSVVYSKNIGKDLLSFIKGAVGGEMKTYTEMVEQGKKIATDRMIDQAKDLNADAIISTLFETCSLMDGIIHFTIYGTAANIR